MVRYPLGDYWCCCFWVFFSSHFAFLIEPLHFFFSLCTSSFCWYSIHKHTSKYFFVNCLSSYILNGLFAITIQITEKLNDDEKFIEEKKLYSSHLTNPMRLKKLNTHRGFSLLSPLFLLSLIENIENGQKKIHFLIFRVTLFSY